MLRGHEGPVNAVGLQDGRVVRVRSTFSSASFADPRIIRSALVEMGR